MIRALLDEKNHQFTLAILQHFNSLNFFSTTYLSWLNLEHFQFSFTNTTFLMQSHLHTKTLYNQGVSEALLANYNEEKNHARLYQKALKKIDLDVNQRQLFLPTSDFFKRIKASLAINASYTLGVMYATETAAIFEHILFKKIAQELCQRSGYDFHNSPLKRFHDLHLDGVEQAHKDELGQFIAPLDQQGEDPNLCIQLKQVQEGACAAIEAMKQWWEMLINAEKCVKEAYHVA